MASSSLAPVTVTLLGGKGYVYNTDDVKRLRMEHRIVGSLIGAPKGWTNGDDRCPPLVLSKEEISLCLKNGWIVLVETKQSSDDIICDADVATDLRSGTSVPVALSSEREMIDVVDWSPEGSFMESLRCIVFEDLHAKKQEVDEYCSDVIRFVHSFVLTSGVKFGGDWLAYPGDPLLFHAQFVVRVVEATDIVHPLFFASAARESHAARKHLLIAFAKEPRELSDIYVQYITISPYEGFATEDSKKKRT